MTKSGYKSIFFPAILAALAITLLIITGCEDPGSYGDTKPVIFGRVAVYPSATEPPMDDPRHDIWAETVTGGIVVSDSAFVTDTSDSAEIDSMTVLVEAIATDEYLYLKAQWVDRSYNVWHRPAVHSLSVDTNVVPPDTIIDSLVVPWDTVIVPPDTTLDTLIDSWNRSSVKVSGADTTWLEQDRFAIIWDAGINGDEKSDCRSMCHAVGDTSINGDRMFTTGGGLVDVWHWQAAMTDPVLLAQDEYWNADGRNADPDDQAIYSNNYDPVALKPIYTHYDSTRFFKPFLHADDTVTFDPLRVWKNNVDIPAHILHDNASGSVADVKCFSSFNRMNGTWLVLMRRALTTIDPNDIDFDAIASRDSVLVTLAVMNHDGDRHFCSRPFYVVFP